MSNTISVGNQGKYRPEIDGLRGIAVIAVIINHFNRDILPSGYLGVDIFFVISGYVITSSLEGRKSKTLLHFLSGFYERRIKRLVPALAIFIISVSILISLFSINPSRELSTGIRALFGISNITLYRGSWDYFAQPASLNPFTHTWSLGVEEQFYFLFPFLIWFSGFGRQKKEGYRNLSLIVGLLSVISFSSFLYLNQFDKNAAYYLMPPRFWEMATGCLVFLGVKKNLFAIEALKRLSSLFSIIMLGVFFLPKDTSLIATISIVVLSAFLIASLRKGTIIFNLLTTRKLVYIGLISYSLYLWHWGVLSISRLTIGVYWWLIPFQVSIMFILAILSYKLIETPIRKN